MNNKLQARQDLLDLGNIELLSSFGVTLPAEKLATALTHSSYRFEYNTVVKSKMDSCKRSTSAASGDNLEKSAPALEYIEDNESLEFLGDCVLNYIIATYLFNKVENKSESLLTKMRASIVKNETLGCIAKKYNLGAHLLVGVGAKNNGVLENLDVLADAVEALIGATYDTHGEKKTREFVISLLDEPIQKALNTEIDSFDYHGSLIEYVRKNFGKELEYVITETGKTHEMEYFAQVKIGEKVFEKASGKSRKIAKNNAAKLAYLEIVKK